MIVREEEVMVRVGNNGTCETTSYTANNISRVPPQSGVAKAANVIELIDVKIYL